MGSCNPTIPICLPALLPCFLPQVSVLALGNAHHSCHGVVVSEAAEMVNDYGDRSAQRVRPHTMSLRCMLAGRDILFLTLPTCN